MEEILELEKVKRPKLIIDDTIDGGRVMFPKKLKEANEMLEKYPPPADFLLERYNKTEQQDGISVQGRLINANADKGTFMVLKMNGVYEINYKIRTTPEILNKIVKNYLNKPISVQIRPQITEKNQFEYELMKVYE
jgi:hypothetical protein